MIFTWTGKGYMVPLSAALTTLGFWGLTDLLNMNVQDEVITVVAAITSGIFLWKLSFWVKKNESSITIVVDDETGETETLKLKHDFCLFPIWFWGVAFGGYGLITAVDLIKPELFA